MVSYHDTTEDVTSAWFSLNTSARPSVGDNEDSVVGPILTGVVLAIIVTCTVVGNVMVLLAVFVNSHLRSTTNYFIVNLAIADLLLGTTVLPFSASLEVFKVWLFGQLFCDIWAAIDVLCCTASIFSLCVISIDRYIGVTRPLQRSTIMTEKRALYIIIFVWLLSMAISVAPPIGWKDPPSPDPYECSVTTQIGYVLFSVSASFYIPLLIILLVYFRIYREAIKHSRFLSTGVKTTKVDESGVTLRVHKGGGGATGRHLYNSLHHQPNTPSHSTSSGSQCPPRPSPIHQSSSSSERSESSVVGQKHASRFTTAGKVAKFKRETKAAKTLGIVVGVFILCWFPFFFILPLSSLCKHCHIPPLMFKIFFWLGYCNSLMNPVIYACSSREFQFAFRRILRCQFRRRPRVFLTDQCERSSSCHDFHQTELSVAARTTHGNRRSSSQKSRKRNKFVRTFKSPASSATCRLHNHSETQNRQSLHIHRLSDSCEAGLDIQLSESPTESIRVLQRKTMVHSGKEVSTCSIAVTTFECSDWTEEEHDNGIVKDSFHHDDLFEEINGRSMYLEAEAR